MLRTPTPRGLLVICSLFFMFLGCQYENTQQEIAKIPVDMEWIRFDQKFYRSSVSDLPALKKEFPYFFPSQFPNEVWERRLTDSLQLALFDEINKAYPTLAAVKTSAKSMFQHVKYYFPQTRIPKIFTVISDVDYHNKIIDADSLMLVSIDTYLGKDNIMYAGIPKYVAANLSEEQLIPDMVSALSERFISPTTDRTLLSQMIWYGKQLYLKDKLIPNTENTVKMGYTQEQLSWVSENENNIWRYFVEQKLLFSSNSSQIYRFVDPAPFTKFYLDIDQESPGRVGQWLGWMIVRSYAENNAVSLQELLELPANELFQKSKYKPSRK